MFIIDLDCNLRDFKQKVEKAPQPIVLKSYVLGWADKCLKNRIPKNKKEAKSLSSETKNDKPKKERAPSKYNLHMKECIPRMKEKNPNIEHTEVFKMCATEYKK